MRGTKRVAWIAYRITKRTRAACLANATAAAAIAITKRIAEETIESPGGDQVDALNRRIRRSVDFEFGRLDPLLGNPRRARNHQRDQRASVQIVSHGKPPTQRSKTRARLNDPTQSVSKYQAFLVFLDRFRDSWAERNKVTAHDIVFAFRLVWCMLGGDSLISENWCLLQRPIDNPPNPYHSQHAEWLEPPPLARVEVYEETSGSILSRNDSPDLPFTWSVNPYRGCQHACAYCYARPYHEYLGLGAGTDFDTKLIVKTNAPKLLRDAFNKKNWTGELVNFSGITDCYQPIEASYGLTRGCLEVCSEYGNPASVVTKSFLVVRDAELLAGLNANVFVSIPFADDETAKLIEPQAPPPSRRFEAVRRLREAGVNVGVFVAPVIPGLNDRDIPTILERAAAAGATSASFTALRLSGSVEPVFLARLREAMPLRADRVVNRIRDMREGNLTNANFGERMRGKGPYWQSIADLFEMSKKRFGLDRGDFDQCDNKTTTQPTASRPASDPAESLDQDPALKNRPGAEFIQLRLPFES